MLLLPWSRFILLAVLARVSQTIASCDASYQSDDFPIAVINISYVDPTTMIFKFESDDIGRYGLGKIQDLTAIVAHVTSNNHTSHKACERLDLDRIPREPYIALIQHGECRDHIKLFHAAEANASGVVVYSYHLDSKLMKVGYKGIPTHYINDYLPIFIIDKDSSIPLRLRPPPRNLSNVDLESLRNYLFANSSRSLAPERLLPFVFINADKGQEIASLVDNGTRVLMSIMCSVYPVRSHASVLFVSISFVFLMVLLLAWLIFYYVQRFRTILSKDVISKRLCTAAQKALERIPVKTITAAEASNEADEECCAVCIETLKANEVIRILPCQHSFHKVCVDPWLLERRSCPMCKLDIVLHFGLVYSGSQESLIEFEDTPIPHRRNSQPDVVHVVTSRRNSSSQTSPYMEDRSTSTSPSACAFVQVNGDYLSCPLEKSWRLPFDPKAALMEDDEGEEDEEDFMASGPSGIVLSEEVEVDDPDEAEPKEDSKDSEVEDVDVVMVTK